MKIAGLIVVLAGAAAILGLTAALETGRRMSRGLLWSIAAACGLALLAMVVTDWPLEVLSAFWAGHSVVSAVVSTLLLAGTAFLAFQAHDKQVQSKLDSSVTAAGMGGIVDHVVDIEVALALAMAEHQPDEQTWGQWSRPGRTMAWLRESREHLFREAGRPKPSDPRVQPLWQCPSDLRGRLSGTISHSSDDVDWRLELLDQCVRRVMNGFRNWATVLGRSRNGQEVLVDLGDLRIGILEAAEFLRNDAPAAFEQITRLRRECRVLALALENGSRSKPERAEVLKTLDPYTEDAQPRRQYRRKRGNGNADQENWKRQKELALQELRSSRQARS